MVDQQVPKRVLREINENQPHREAWSEDLEILLDPKIQARPLALPGLGAIKIRNTDMSYYYCRLSNGSRPDTARYMQLRTMGFENATPWNEKDKTGDVEVLVGEANKDEIRSGDRILLKCPKMIFAAYKKQHMLDSLRSTAQRGVSKQGDGNEEGRRMMTSATNLTGVSTYIPSEGELANMNSRRGPDNSVSVGKKGA